jgi:hypothetical protein
MDRDDERLRLGRRVYGADHDDPDPGPRPDRAYAELVGGPLDGLLLDIDGWPTEDVDDGVALSTELSRWPGGRALYDPRPGEPRGPGPASSAASTTPATPPDRRAPGRSCRSARAFQFSSSGWCGCTMLAAAAGWTAGGRVGVSRLGEPDCRRVLPGDVSWLLEVQYLEQRVLPALARAAMVAGDRFDEDAFVLPGETYLAVADILGRLAEELLPGAGAEDGLVLLFLRSWELDYLWQVLTVLRRAQAGDPDAAEVRELLHDVGFGLDRSVEQMAGDLQRLVAVLTLDIPAVRTLADAILTRSMPVGLGVAPPDQAAVHEATAEVRAV